MKTISPAQLAEKLRAYKGARALTITALTDTRARKTGNPYSQVMKIAKVNGFFGVDYAAAVERQQGKDAQPVGFQARPHPWGDKVCSALREHRKTKELYLTLQPKRTIDKPVYFGRNPTSGALVQVKKETIEAFLPDKRSAAPSQGVEHEVITRDYALSNIVAIVGLDQPYRVRHETGTRKAIDPAGKPAKVKNTEQARPSQSKPAHSSANGLRAALASKLGEYDSDNPKDEGLHPMDQGDHGDHERD